MDSKEFAKKWKGAFARGVPKEVIAQYVDAEGCLLWHVFTWGKAPCLEREAADKAFDKADKTGAFIAKERAWKGGGCNIEYSIEDCPLGLKSADLAEESEVFVVGRNFQWTYVVTHETGCGLGPYFAQKRSEP